MCTLIPPCSLHCVSAVSHVQINCLPVLAVQVISAGRFAFSLLHLDRFVDRLRSALDRGNGPPIHEYDWLRFALVYMGPS